MKLEGVYELTRRDSSRRREQNISGVQACSFPELMRREETCKSTVYKSSDRIFAASDTSNHRDLIQPAAHHFNRSICLK